MRRPLIAVRVSKPLDACVLFCPRLVKLLIKGEREHAPMEKVRGVGCAVWPLLQGC